MKKRLLLIDGHNLLFQMFFGMPAKIAGKDGRPIQGVIGFIGAVNKLLSMTEATHAAVIFDSETHNPRFEILNEYKATRPDYSDMPDEDNPFSILPDIYRALCYMGIKNAEAKNAECDDVIASFCINAPDDTEVFVSSFDSDYFQLINEKTRIIRYKGASSIICDKRYIEEKLGVSPELYADYKSLVGDTADNIKGIRGVGPKTAAKIISAFGSLNNMLSAPEIICDEKIKKLITENAELLRRNLSLIKLDAHAPLPFTFEEIKINEAPPRTMDVIRGIDI